MVTKRKDPKDYVKTGRPSDYTPELAERICELVAKHPTALEIICDMYDDIPSHDTIKRWKRTNPEFSAMYYEAKTEQADELADYTWRRIQNLDLNKDDIAKAALELKFAQWQNARLAPKRWRESTQVDSNVEVAMHEDKLKELK